MERSDLAAKLGASPLKTPNAKSQTPKKINEPEAGRFMAAFAEAVAGKGDVFLCDPSWGEHERAQVDALLQSKVENPKSKIPSGWLLIPTGGTGGKLKFARHDAATIASAVDGFCRHFALARVHALGLLPLHHVSGFMAWMRCALTGGEYRHAAWKEIEGGALPPLPETPEGWVLSLVPTQLERLLSPCCRAGSPNPASKEKDRPTESWRTGRSDRVTKTENRMSDWRGSATPPYNEATVAWLRRFRIIFIGGAPASASLLDRAAALGLRLSPGYGMTETAAMVAALRPDEFLAGTRSSGTALPHASLALADDGRIRIGGPSLFRGYFPDWRAPGEFVTQDLGRLGEDGHLHVLGRSDAVIITGGEKVNPAEVEAALADTGAFAQVAVIGVPDAAWGQRVVAAYPATARPDLKQVEQAIKRRLSVWKRPKQYIPVADWPVNAQGKVNRAELARRLGAAGRGAG